MVLVVPYFYGPDGRVLCQAGPTEQLMPLEIDLDVVRSRKERGILGQSLKKIRDNPMHFAAYNKDVRHPYLDS